MFQFSLVGLGRAELPAALLPARLATLLLLAAGLLVRLAALLRLPALLLLAALRMAALLLLLVAFHFLLLLPVHGNLLHASPIEITFEPAAAFSRL